MEYFKVGRLLGSSNDNNFALFMSPDISEGIEVYKNRVTPWFVTSKNLNFATAEDFQDWINVCTRISFMQKASQAPDVPRALQQKYVAAYQKVCADAQDNPVTITVSRYEVFEEGLVLFAPLLRSPLTSTRNKVRAQIAAPTRDHRGCVRGCGIGRGRCGKDIPATGDLSCL